MCLSNNTPFIKIKDEQSEVRKRDKEQMDNFIVLEFNKSPKAMSEGR